MSRMFSEHGFYPAFELVAVRNFRQNLFRNNKTKTGNVLVSIIADSEPKVVGRKQL